MRQKTSIALGIVSGIIFAALVTGLFFHASYAGDPDSKGVPHRVVADYIHAIIEADRTLFATHVVQRMHETGTVLASEKWKERNALPLPAQMLQLSGERVKTKELGLEFRLASLWPIYRKNGPHNELEALGLKAVRQDPNVPFTGYTIKNDQPYYVAIYPDIAVASACVNCHNRHILSPKRDQQLGDVMGGIIISFPADYSKVYEFNKQ